MLSLVKAEQVKPAMRSTSTYRFMAVHVLGDENGVNPAPEVLRLHGRLPLRTCVEADPASRSRTNIFVLHDIQR